MTSSFVISLDFELMWGVRDHLNISDYGKNILGVREAIPRMLDLFDRLAIHATWATVGMLLSENKDELLAMLPSTLPTYFDQKLSNYSYLNEVGQDESKDKYYFGSNLAKTIASCPGQEIGSHSFSHFYCQEPGVTLEQFGADLAASIVVSARRGFQVRSFVFPRNQYTDDHLSILAKQNISVFRGNEKSWIYRPSPGKHQTPLRRLVRLADQYIDLTGSHVPAKHIDCKMVNVASSRFLRPFSPRLRQFDELRLRRIFKAMDVAARSGGIFHLWWHPHNFGQLVDENIFFLSAILNRFKQNHDRFGMKSMNMKEFE